MTPEQLNHRISLLFGYLSIVLTYMTYFINREMERKNLSADEFNELLEQTALNDVTYAEEYITPAAMSAGSQIHMRWFSGQFDEQDKTKLN